MRLHWPMRAQPLLNGARVALRPALTGVDRGRYLALTPTLDDEMLALAAKRGARLIRADLIEDKQHGGVIGATCLLRQGSRQRVTIHLQGMNHQPRIENAVMDLLRKDFPRLEIALDLPVACLTSSTEVDAAEIQQSLQNRFVLPADYAQNHQLQWIDEPARLHYAGRDYVGRTLWLEHGTMQAWHAMRQAAHVAGISLEAVSGFRSMIYQAGIVQRKLDRGQSMEQILAVNTAPGYSEHHSGRALDIGTPGSAPAEEVFESTAAFEWLRRHAAQFGFRMSYPRGNEHGVIYEPWHWYYTF